MSEELVIRQCSPTLAGLKTGNLFTSSYSSEQELKREIRRLNRLLVPKGLRILPMRYAKNKVLIYVYRPAKLRQDLADGSVQTLLQSFGYPAGKPELCVVHLLKKLRADAQEALQKQSPFPHEIGLFLGYPPEDVRGFIENRAACSKCVGCWKVYGDVEQAQKKFQQYKKCTDVYCVHWMNGTPIERLTVAV